MTQALERPQPTLPSNEDGEFDRNEHANYKVHDNYVGLGASAVKTAIDMADFDLLGIANSEHDEHLQRQEITLARDRLEEMTDTQKGMFNTFLGERAASAWLDERLGFGGDETEKDYVAKLLARNEDGENVVDDTLMLHFLEWHNYQLMKMQKELDAESEKIKPEFKTMFLKAIKDGWIPKWVKDRIDSRLENSVIAVDDGFATSHEYVDGSAYRSEQGEEVVLSPRPTQNKKKILTHEFIHVLDGYDEEIAEEREQDSYGMGRLFVNEKTWTAESDAGRALNEAVVEHLADSMYKDNNVNRIHPGYKEREGATYYAERYLLHVLANEGMQQINIRTFIAAHFDDGTQRDRRGRTPLEKLRVEIDKAFPGMNVIGALSSLESIEEILEYANELNKTMHEKRDRRFKRDILGAVAAVAVGTGIMQPFAGTLHNEQSPAVVHDWDHGSIIKSGGASSNGQPGSGIYEDEYYGRTAPENDSYQIPSMPSDVYKVPSEPSPQPYTYTYTIHIPIPPSHPHAQGNTEIVPAPASK